MTASGKAIKILDKNKTFFVKNKRNTEGGKIILALHICKCNLQICNK